MHNDIFYLKQPKSKLPVTWHRRKTDLQQQNNNDKFKSLRPTFERQQEPFLDIDVMSTNQSQQKVMRQNTQE